MKVSIVIPNYNGEILLRKNLPKVIEAAGNAEIVVADDGSTDKSIEFLKTQKVKIVESKENKGFSTNTNKGVAAAEGDIIVLLNTDVYPEKDFLFPLINDFKDPSVFAVGCLDKSRENGNIVWRGRGIGKWKRGFMVHARGEIDKDNTLWASGGSSAFRKSIWDKLGGLNTIYDPFYWEDIDLSYRALKSGYKVMFEKKSIVNHEHSKGVINTANSKARIKTIAYRNQFIFVWENATDFSLQIYHMLFLPYHLVKALTRGDWPFFAGFAKAFVLLPKIIQSSIKYQKYFIKKDSEVMKGFK